ncbi:MAG: adenylosuccinate synthetase, partial [Bacteroidetes bacterium]
SDFKKKYDFLVSKHKQLLALYDFKYDLGEHEPVWFDGIESVKQFNCIESEKYLSDAFAGKKTVLAEGAQGSLLDIDFGSYPFVTSSSTVCAGACTGLGIPPNKIGRVLGIFKAYCTRVGSGPFPTELNDATGGFLRKAGNEFGSTTGRPRRCGWLDLPALKYAVAISGVTELIMMKADVLSGLDTIKVCTHYKIQTPSNSPEGGEHGSSALSPLGRDGEGLIDFLPYDITSHPLSIVYKEFKGWKSDLQDLAQNIPAQLEDYINFIEKEIKVPITMISVGPDRKQIIARKGVPA